MSTPSITSSDGNLRIVHREYIAEVVGVNRADPQYVDVEYYEINPGLAPVFPWLNGIAKNFESYTVNRLSVEYVPACSTSTAGSVFISPDFDVSDYSPESIIQLQAMPGSVRSPAWTGCRMSPPNNLYKKLVSERMVRTGTIDDVDYKLYDSAVVYVATAGFTATVGCGSLWIDYDITLRTPSIDITVDTRGSAYYSGAVNVDKTHLLGTGAGTLGQDDYLPIFEYLTDSAFKILRPGNYFIDALVTGTGLNATPYTVTPDANAVVSPTTASVVNGAATSASYNHTLKVNRPSIVTLASPAAWTTVSDFKMRISPYASGLPIY
jgi:hypothetical protein